jgi:anti-sigma B factor antagonist
MTPELQVDFEQIGTSIFIAPRGEIGYVEANSFGTAIKRAFDSKPTRVVVDLAGITFMGTPGIAVLVQGLQTSKKTSIPLVLCGMAERVRAVFEIARLQTVFTIVKDRAAASAP